MTRQLEEAVRVTHGLERNKHINKNNIEIDVKCLNRSGQIPRPQIMRKPFPFSVRYSKSNHFL